MRERELVDIIIQTYYYYRVLERFWERSPERISQKSEEAKKEWKKREAKAEADILCLKKTIWVPILSFIHIIIIHYPLLLLLLLLLFHIIIIIHMRVFIYFMKEFWGVSSSVLLLLFWSDVPKDEKRANHEAQTIKMRKTMRSPGAERLLRGDRERDAILLLLHVFMSVHIMSLHVPKKKKKKKREKISQRGVSRVFPRGLREFQRRELLLFMSYYSLLLFYYSYCSVLFVWCKMCRGAERACRGLCKEPPHRREFLRACPLKELSMSMSPRDLFHVKFLCLMSCL